MSEFTTNIKTQYTDVKRDVVKKKFNSKYENKNNINVVSGRNKRNNKRYASRLIK